MQAVGRDREAWHVRWERKEWNRESGLWERNGNAARAVRGERRQWEGNGGAWDMMSGKGKWKAWGRGRKPWEAWLVLLAMAFAAEIFLFNFSAWRSLFARDGMEFRDIRVEGGAKVASDISKEPAYETAEGLLTLYIDDLVNDRKIHNLRMELAVSEPGTMIPYTVSLSDEGNYYPYSLPERIWAPGLVKTHYVRLHPAGKVSGMSIQLTVPAGCLVAVESVCANVRAPFAFRLVRVVLAWVALLLTYYARAVGRGSMEAGKWIGSGRQRAVTAAAILLLIGMAWALTQVNPICVESPWPHHKQYQELAEALADGKVSLAAQPSEELLQAENPYDTIYLQANGIPYQADYAFYEGKYYVYFGIVPELLLYLPCYLLTGRHLPNYMAVFLFYSGFILAVFALYREVVKQWFVNTPFFLYILACALTVCSGNYLFVIARPDLYDTPIMAANMFTAAGLWLWIKGKYTLHPKHKKIAYLSGSLCMALVAGCRPQMLLFSFLAVPLFWEETVKRRELFGKRNLLETFSICLPYALVAAGIMYYNAIRFGSPFDFGAAYSLTSNDMTKRTFSLHQALLGVWHYFLKPPVVESEFPFLQGIQIASGTYMGRLNAEYTYGGILVCNAFAWLLALLGREKRILKHKGIYAFALVNLAASAALGVVDVTGAGILQRYMVDMVWGILFVSVFVLFSLWEVSNGAGRRRSFMMLLGGICVLQGLYGLGVVMGNGDLSVNVLGSNPELYYYLKSLLMF